MQSGRECNWRGICRGLMGVRHAGIPLGKGWNGLGRGETQGGGEKKGDDRGERQLN